MGWCVGLSGGLHQGHERGRYQKGSARELHAVTPVRHPSLFAIWQTGSRLITALFVASVSRQSRQCRT